MFAPDNIKYYYVFFEKVLVEVSFYFSLFYLLFLILSVSVSLLWFFAFLILYFDLVHLWSILTRKICEKKKTFLFCLHDSCSIWKVCEKYLKKVIAFIFSPTTPGHYKHFCTFFFIRKICCSFLKRRIAVLREVQCLYFIKFCIS